MFSTRIYRSSRITAEYELPDADGTRDTLRQTVENASTRQLCQQAAMEITKRLSTPQRSAQVTLDRETFGLVGALNIADAPIDPQVVQEIDTDERSVDVRLGEDQSPREVIDDVERRVESVAKRL